MAGKAAPSAAYGGNLRKLCAIRFLFWMFFFSPVMTAFFTQWGGMDLFQVFLLNSWFFLWNFALEAPTGALADRLGRKWSLALGSLAGMAATLVYISRPDFRVFLLAEVIFAFSFTLHSGADDALAYDSLLAMGRQKGSKAFLARMENFKLAGLILATLTGGFIAKRWGLAAPMAAYVAPSIIAFLAALSIQEPPRKGGAGRRAPYGRILREGLRFFLKHKVLGVLSLELAVTNAVLWALIWLFQPLLQRDGCPLQYFGVVHAASCLGQILILSHIGRVESWAGSKRGFLLWATVLTGAMFLVLGMVHWLPATVLAVILGFSFGLTRMPVFTSYMNKYIPSDRRATVLSASSMLRTFSQVVMNLVSGALAKWSVSGTMVVLGAVLIVLTAFSRIEERHLRD